MKEPSDGIMSLLSGKITFKDFIKEQEEITKIKRKHTMTIDSPEVQMDKPLFIPLKSEYYEAFEDGSKKNEYRLHGKRWNTDTVWIGRRVTLSKGYGKKNRLHGEISGVSIDKKIQLPFDVQVAIENIYGDGNHEIICIRIDLDVLEDTK